MSEHLSEFIRIQQAYVQMAEVARYRPAAPGDGMGGIELSRNQLQDAAVLAEEARRYAEQFIQEEDRLCFHVGVSNWTTNRVLVYTLEAARCLCCGTADHVAQKLLEMAIGELRP